MKNNEQLSVSNDGKQAPKGFISIIAVGIFALLIIFGIVVQIAVSDTYISVKNSNNYYAARDMADSLMEQLQYEVNTKNGPGFSTGGTINCQFENGVQVNNNAGAAGAAGGAGGGAGAAGAGAEQPLCTILKPLVGNAKVMVGLEIKGRPDMDEKLQTAKCQIDAVFGGGAVAGNNQKCYTVPFPGSGDAGSMCKVYTEKIPKFLGEAEAQNDVPADFTGIAATIDQVNYSCNWNKLSFGSKSTDRVGIPLYYDQGANNIVNPFKDNNLAKNFILRLRTPCKCGVPNENGEVPAGTINCQTAKDPSVCADDQRYVLNNLDDGDPEQNGAIVVNWQITGLCPLNENDPNSDYENCVLQAVPGGNVGNVTPSVITELLINTSNGNNFIILSSGSNEQSTWGNDVNNQILRLIFTAQDIPGSPTSFLKIIQKPTLNLFLKEALIDIEGKNIPYLEYQVLTDYPVSNPKIKMEVTVKVNGNTFQKTLFQEEDKELIDFAVKSS